MRAHVTRLVQLLAPLGVDIAMTTNGVRLPELAHDLAAAGLARINVSLDSLQRERFFASTKRDELVRVQQSLTANSQRMTPAVDQVPPSNGTAPSLRLDARVRHGGGTQRAPS